LETLLSGGRHGSAASGETRGNRGKSRLSLCKEVLIAMKRTLALVLALGLVLSLFAGCGAKRTEDPSNSAPADTTPPPSDTTPAPADTTPSVAYSPDGSVIFEKDGVTVTTRGLGADPTDVEPWPVIWVDIENTGSEDVCLGVDNGSVNGFMTTVVLANFYDEEDGIYHGASYDFSCTIPAGGSERRALTYYRPDVPGVDDKPLGVLEFAFTTAPDEYSWRDFVSDPVTIVTGEPVDDVDVKTFGTVVIDNDVMTLVIGRQDYHDWFGPMFGLYVENKSDRFLGLWPESADADGMLCDYLLGGVTVAPGKKAGSSFSFDGEARALKGVEHLTVQFRLGEADTADGLSASGDTQLDPITVQYPPQVWGAYENGGLTLTVRPRINDLLTVDTPEGDTLFTVSETASLTAGGHEGAGWLFSIRRVGEDALHKLLCGDMSGTDVIAKDRDGSYYLLSKPTDVRYERATAEEEQRDRGQWTTLCLWAEDMVGGFLKENGLEGAFFGNSPVNICLARAAYEDGVNALLSTGEYGPIAVGGADGALYADFVNQFAFDAVEDEMPDGDCVSLTFPEEDVRLDFFLAPDAYVRMVSGGAETLYQAIWWSEDVSNAEAILGWYYALAEQAGLRTPDAALARYCGEWHETIAGRGTISAARSPAPGKMAIEARWPESAAVVYLWQILATHGDGKLVYENALFESREYDADGDYQTLDWNNEASGWFSLGDAGELIWHDDLAEGGGDSVFVK